MFKKMYYQTRPTDTKIRIRCRSFHLNTEFSGFAWITFSGEWKIKIIISTLDWNDERWISRWNTRVEIFQNKFIFGLFPLKLKFIRTIGFDKHTFVWSIKFCVIFIHVSHQRTHFAFCWLNCVRVFTYYNYYDEHQMTHISFGALQDSECVINVD